MAKATAGNLPGYETTFITRGELSADKLKELHSRVEAIVGQYDGKIVLQEDWGSRKLAYPIQKEVRGTYTYVVYTGKGEVVHEIERNLRINEHVLRFLTVNLEKEFEPETFAKQRADAQAAAKRREEEREARREERMAERRGYDDGGGRGGYRGDREDRGDREERGGYRAEREEAPAAGSEE